MAELEKENPAHDNDVKLVQSIDPEVLKRMDQEEGQEQEQDLNEIPSKEPLNQKEEGKHVDNDSTKNKLGSSGEENKPTTVDSNSVMISLQFPYSNQALRKDDPAIDTEEINKGEITKGQSIPNSMLNGLAKVKLKHGLPQVLTPELQSKLKNIKHIGKGTKKISTATLNGEPVTILWPGTDAYNNVMKNVEQNSDGTYKIKPGSEKAYNDTMREIVKTVKAHQNKLGQGNNQALNQKSTTGRGMRPR